MDDLNKELFLDILTKEEKEALLTKKMEDIRKKNDALRKRHEEIEADKRVAAKNSPNKNVSFVSRDNSHSGSTSPRKELKPLLTEEKQGPRGTKPAGRGRPQGGGRGKQPGTFRVNRGEAKPGEVDITGHDGRHAARTSTANHSAVHSDDNSDDSDDEWVPGSRRVPVKEGRLPPAEAWDSDEEEDCKRRPLSWGGDGHRNGENWDTGIGQGPSQSGHSTTHRGDANHHPLHRGDANHHPLHRGDANHHPLHRGETTHRPPNRGEATHRPPNRGETTHRPPNRGETTHRPPNRGEATHHPPNGGDDLSSSRDHGALNSRPQRTSGNLGQENGPPPDPSYNFLSDRRREGGHVDISPDSPEKQKWKTDTRRHPKNYGGQDFNNVKVQIRTSKDRQERPKSGGPRTKMELAMAMTGRERRQYMDWKTERDRVDQDRLDRQKANNGEWRRAWDAEKTQQDFEHPQSPQRTEPAKRPAGRIGSGRFDRGEREDRHRGDTPRLKAGVKSEQEVPAKPIGRGRARGRGRGRGERSPRQRTTSSGDDSRKVERRNDLLVVKIDNSGNDREKSVEVEYLDDDVRSNSAVSVKSNSAASAKSENSSHDSHSKPAQAARHEEHQFDDHDDGYEGVRHRRQMLSQSVGDENDHDESWEDCPEDCEFYAEDDYIHVDADEYSEPLRLECKLNPDAPEFTPTSPDFMKTPPGHVKVIDWVAEVTANLSPTSPPPTMDGVDNEECKKGIFRDKKPECGRGKKSSSRSGVNDTRSRKDLGASYIEDDEAGKAAPEASKDAAGDVGKQEDQDQKNSMDSGRSRDSDGPCEAPPRIKTECVDDDSVENVTENVKLAANDASSSEKVSEHTSDKAAKEEESTETNEDHATDSYGETSINANTKDDNSPLHSDQIMSDPPQDSSEETITCKFHEDSDDEAKEECKAALKEESTENSTQEFEEAVTKEPKEVLNEEPKDILKEEPKEVMKEEPKEVMKEEPVDVLKEAHKEVLKEDPKDVLNEEPKEVLKEESKEVLKEEPKVVLQEEPKEVLKEDPVDVLKEAHTEVLKEDTKDVLKEQPKEVLKEESKEVLQEEHKEVLKEEPVDVLQEVHTEVLKEDTKDVLKEESKAVLQEEPKAVLKEEPKDVLKEEPKEVLQEEPKEILKEEPTEVLKGEPQQDPKEELKQDLKEEPVETLKEADCDESAQQMAKSDTDPESDNTQHQLEQMEDIPRPAEANEKSSALRTGEEPVPMLKTTTSTAAAEDSHVE